MKRTIYNSGDSINGVVFLREAEKTTLRRGVFKCVCGNEFITSFGNIRNGHTTSCGCLKIAKAIKHGHTIGGKTSSEFKCWIGIRKRCLDKDSKFYKYYGGRGIKMEESWVNSFEAFLLDVGRKPSSDMSLDRIDNNEGYFKWNCRWATMHTQSRNRRNNNLITHNGKTLCIQDWAKETGIKAGTIRTRINTRGWNPILAITVPGNNKRHYA